jgi:hypothetical protein
MLQDYFGLFEKNGGMVSAIYTRPEFIEIEDDSSGQYEVRGISEDDYRDFMERNPPFHLLPHILLDTVREPLTDETFQALGLFDRKNRRIVHVLPMRSELLDFGDYSTERYKVRKISNGAYMDFMKRYPPIRLEGKMGTPFTSQRKLI